MSSPEYQDDPLLESEPPSPFFEAWATAVLRFRWLVLLACAAFTGVGGWAIATHLEVDTSDEAFAANNSASQHLLEEYRDEFGRDDLFLVLVEGDVFTVEYLERLRALHEEIAALDMEVPSLGERLADRQARRGRYTPQPKKRADSGATGGGRGSAPPQTAPPANVVDDEDSGEGAESGTDEWGDEPADGAFAGDEGWGEEKGGSIIDELTSLINVRRTRSVAGGIQVGELCDPFPTAADLPALRAEVLGDATLVGQVVGKAGRHSVIVIRTQFMNEPDSVRVNRAIEEIAARHDRPGFGVLVSGLPAMSTALKDLMMSDLRRMLLVSLLLMTLTLIVLFRHVVAVVAPLVVVGLSAMNTFAFMAIADMPVTMLSNILPAFLFCVGLGDSIHLISVFRDLRRHGVAKEAAIVRAVATTGTPVLFTSLTTMVGLVSFKFASLNAIQDMGVAGAFGVGMAFLFSVTVLPISLLLVGDSLLLGARARGEADRLDAFLRFCSSLSGEVSDTGEGPEPAVGRRRRRLALLVGMIIVGGAMVSLTALRVWHNPLSWIPDDKPVSISFATMDEHIGGTANVQLLVDGHPERGIRDKALLEGLDKLVEHIRGYRDAEVGLIVGNSVGILDVVKETHRALHGGEQAEYRVPDTDRGVADALFMFQNVGPDDLRRVATNDLGRAQISLRIRWLEATAYRPLTEHIERGIETLLPPDVQVRATGSVYTLISTIGRLIGDLLRSFGIAFVIITILMIVMLRSFKLGLVAIVPNLMPIALIMGMMGLVGIPIDMNNILIASIAMGIAVDDTIHFLHHWRVAFQQTGNVEESIRESMQHSGRAMVSTSMILMMGFFAYMGAEMMNIQRFGLLIGITVLFALLIDLIFAPALLRTWFARAAADRARPASAVGAPSEAELNPTA